MIHRSIWFEIRNNTEREGEKERAKEKSMLSSYMINGNFKNENNFVYTSLLHPVFKRLNYFVYSPPTWWWFLRGFSSLITLREMCSLKFCIIVQNAPLKGFIAMSALFQEHLLLTGNCNRENYIDWSVINEEETFFNQIFSGYLVIW